MSETTGEEKEEEEPEGEGNPDELSAVIEEITEGMNEFDLIGIPGLERPGDDDE